MLVLGEFRNERARDLEEASGVGRARLQQLASDETGGGRSGSSELPAFQEQNPTEALRAGRAPAPRSGRLAPAGVMPRARWR